MLVTREQMVRRLCDRSGYYQRDIRILLNALDEEIFAIFEELTADDPIYIQISDGIKIGEKVVPERNRVDPRNQRPIVCGETVKPFAVFSERFREITQNTYDDKKQKKSD